MHSLLASNELELYDETKISKVNYFILPEMGSRIASEEDRGLGWINVGIDPSAPSC